MNPPLRFLPSLLVASGALAVPERAWSQTAAPAAAPAAAAAPTIAPFPADHPLTRALATITGDDLRDDVEWLASDERMGRCAGEEGCDAAAEWIAARFEELGLEPLGDDGTFLQHFQFRVRGGGGRDAMTQNVVGRWPGSDPAFADQVIVLGAHYDHVGTADSADAGRLGGPKGDDRIWNGADDNASGTSTLIEVARAFALGDLKPKRSVIFVAFSGEEQGLFGSRWYCEHPPVALEKTTAMVNMDMVGRNPELPVDLAAMGSLDGELWSKLVEASRGASPALPFKLEPGWLPDSDHASFLDFGVPALFLNTGEHADYHHVTDSADTLAYDHMTEIGRFLAALAWNTANCEEKFVHVKPRPQGRPQKRLGIASDGALASARMAELGFEKSQGGFEVHGLDPEGVGAKAGLKEGDLILSIDGTTLDPDDPATSLRRLVGGAAKGKDVPIVVWRDAAKVTLQARWE